MKIDATLFQIAVIFLPGLLCAGIVDKLIVHKERKSFDFILRAFGFGTSIYVFYYLLAWLIEGNPPKFLAKASSPSIIQLENVSIIDVAWAVGIAVIFAVIWSALSNQKVLMRTMQKMNVTKKYGDEDIWDYTLNLTIPDVEYCYLRDFDKKLVYSGWIKAFSEDPNQRELLLQDVEVYALDSGKKLFDTPLIYVALVRDEFHIEFPYRP